MKTIILPGYSPHNKEWAYEIKEKMGLPNVIVHEWRHWSPAQTSGSEKTKGSFNEAYEAAEILKKIDDSKVNIIAKSVGTSIAMHLIQKVPKLTNKVVLCGIPINVFSEKRKELFKFAIPNFPRKNIVIFQNVKDNLGSFEKVSDFIHSIDTRIEVIEKPRSDHNYPYPKDFKRFLEE